MKPTVGWAAGTLDSGYQTQCTGYSKGLQTLQRFSITWLEVLHLTLVKEMPKM